jgi:hypothetical protein
MAMCFPKALSGKAAQPMRLHQRLQTQLLQPAPTQKEQAERKKRASKELLKGVINKPFEPINLEFNTAPALQRGSAPSNLPSRTLQRPRHQYEVGITFESIRSMHINVTHNNSVICLCADGGLGPTRLSGPVSSVPGRGDFPRSHRPCRKSTTAGCWRACQCLLHRLEAPRAWG